MSRRCKWPSAKRPPDVYAIPNARAREGIPHEPLPDPAETNRNGARALPDGTTDQNLVPKQANEVKEGNPSHQRAQRTRKAGAGAKSSGSRRPSGGGAELVAARGNFYGGATRPAGLR
ncbi:unnamed protein product [Diabrotica balteata]|uniref:Uncharacterized protein n=1 Tax=Diabrotica balteata TaxID=107213 RepID=A0A9N9SS51_DIABA|nr:unnamed protein product [Diabrotica balteata]